MTGDCRVNNWFVVLCFCWLAGLQSVDSRFIYGRTGGGRKKLLGGERINASFIRALGFRSDHGSGSKEVSTTRTVNS